MRYKTREGQQELELEHRILSLLAQAINLPERNRQPLISQLQKLGDKYYQLTGRYFAAARYGQKDRQVKI